MGDACAPDATILIGDNMEHLPRLASASVDLVVTSPPYADLRPDAADLAPDEYVPWLLERTRELLRVLKPRGSMALNVGSCVVDGYEHPYLHHLVIGLHEQGWRMAQEYYWLKQDPMPGRFGSRCIPAVEPIYHLVQRPDYAWHDRDIRRPYRSRRHVARPKSALRNPDGAARDFYRAGGALPPNYFIAPKAGRRDGADRHSAVFPAWLPAFFIRCCTSPGDLVLDPFAGSGTVGVAALALGRRCILIERDPRHERTIRDRLRLDHHRLALEWPRPAQQLSLEAT